VAGGGRKTGQGQNFLVTPKNSVFLTTLLLFENQSWGGLKILTVHTNQVGNPNSESNNTDNSFVVRIILFFIQSIVHISFMK